MEEQMRINERILNVLAVMLVDSPEGISHAACRRVLTPDEMKLLFDGGLIETSSYFGNEVLRLSTKGTKIAKIGSDMRTHQRIPLDHLSADWKKTIPEAYVARANTLFEFENWTRGMS